ncbi:FecR family protein [Paracoccus binzhouensis]|uniref:FecR family protein n=1 Tax=Paracoccus binzhouensis TaxID=2796149 RepID=UPI0018EF35D4|nr:FecR domain-containing protein [Paracoccus binzhouensis]
MKGQSSDSSRPGGDAEAEAAEWVIRLADPEAADEARAAFRDWLGRDPAHHGAFENARRTWQELGLIGSMARRRRGRGTLALAALAAGLSLWFWQDDLRIRLRADHVAAVGENLAIMLPDGSRAELASGAALAEDYDGTQRLIRLLEGRAYFTAAPAAQQQGRPFVVEAGGIRITALGTQFSVDLHENEVAVLVAEHSVRVEPIAGPAASVVLAEGMGVDARPGLIPTPTLRDMDFANAWRSGELVFDDRPLGEVVAELNRYRHGRIVLRGKDLAARRVSGVFHTDDIGQAVDRIAGELGLRRLSVPPLVTVLY